MVHLDLFSGIGGFSVASDQVFRKVEHIFCDSDAFCQKILRRHWPESYIYGDIRALTHADIERCLDREAQIDTTEWDEAQSQPCFGVDIVTGGFPCQPFSSVGLRRGPADDRYLWPEMFRLIQEVQPTWVIAENVYGLVTWNDGMVLERVCTDLESEGYEVQPFIIPACAVNAPHRRDRIWFVANSRDERRQRSFREKVQRQPIQPQETTGRAAEWARGWTIPKPHCVGVDDGVSDRLHRIKALGNAIVPQVAVEIMKAIKDAQL